MRARAVRIQEMLLRAEVLVYFGRQAVAAQIPAATEEESFVLTPAQRQRKKALGRFLTYKVTPLRTDSFLVCARGAPTTTECRNDRVTDIGEVSVREWGAICPGVQGAEDCF